MIVQTQVIIMTPEQIELVNQFKEQGYVCLDGSLPTPGRFGFFSVGKMVVSAPTIEESLEKMQAYISNNGGAAA